jgi:transposase
LTCGSPGWGGVVKKTLHAAEQSRPDVVAQRKQWPQRLAGVSVHRLVFVDESGANTQMTRRYGRSPIGQRLACPVPHGHYQTTTLIAAVRLQGTQAPWLFGGAMDGELFLAWVKQGLAPCLQRDDVVIMDNLATHKVVGVREAIEGAGARLEYLPPYSPDFNPIEPLWSKVKQTLKSRAPRNERQLLKAARTAFAAITPTDCQGFFLHAGYAT